ncbi:MAG: hypothetical protein KJO54_11495 [Gammaproteobacteria bacterium]|nr:hypothetical protein [Gammaproteobacteria bacterium]NNF61242.1 hypothetical protein [Gammaproteobacteria bacterium]NNM20782.1 hypothetical protein [Gammaproteobacteria bacterium]
MNKRILWLPGAVLLASCATYGPQMNQLGIQSPTCDILNVPANCSNPGASGPSAPSVNFNTNPNAMTVAPRNVCANRNATLVFKLTPNNPGGDPRPFGSVSVVAKDLSNTWLIGTNNSDREEISIEVPDYVVAGDYEYTLFVNDGNARCVDPRVHVEH